ncbi:MAG: response regulator [Candidatus Eisenbacteria bacterium]
MSLNVLLVDDSETVLDVLARTLKLAALDLNQVYRAANGQEALQLLKANWVDLVFADINMPVMGGVEMVETMARDGLLKTIPVVIVSTEGSVTRIQSLRDKGVAGYIRKPFTPESIKAVVQEVMAAKH